MAQTGYFSCAGCGRLFELSEEEIAEYKEHDCDDSDSSAVRSGVHVDRYPGDAIPGTPA